MIDAMMIASADGNFDEKEEAIISEYFEMFKLTKDETKELRYIYEMFYVQDANALYRYFGKQNDDDIYIIKKELFQYLIDYYEINFDLELTREEQKILTFEFFKPTFENGGLGEGATEIMTKPVSNAQFCIYLNRAYIAKDIGFNDNSKIIDNKTKVILMDLKMSNIEFNNNEFIVNNAKNEDEKITGITYVFAEMFIKWISKYNNNTYKLSKFTYRRLYMKDFKYPIFGEFYYSLDNEYSGYYYARETFCDTANGGFLSCWGIGNALNILSSNSYFSNKTSFRMMKLPNE